MIAEGHVSLDEPAVDVYRDNEVFQGHSLTKFRTHWNELKEEMQGEGKFYSFGFFSVVFFFFSLSNFSVQS